MSDSLNLPLKILKSGPGINLVAFAGRSEEPPYLPARERNMGLIMVILVYD